MPSRASRQGSASTVCPEPTVRVDCSQSSESTIRVENPSRRSESTIRVHYPKSPGARPTRRASECTCALQPRMQRPCAAREGLPRSFYVCVFVCVLRACVTDPPTCRAQRSAPTDPSCAPPAPAAPAAPLPRPFTGSPRPPPPALPRAAAGCGAAAATKDRDAAAATKDRDAAAATKDRAAAAAALGAASCISFSVRRVGKRSGAAETHVAGPGQRQARVEDCHQTMVWAGATCVRAALGPSHSARGRARRSGKRWCNRWQSECSLSGRAYRIHRLVTARCRNAAYPVVHTEYTVW